MAGLVLVALTTLALSSGDGGERVAVVVGNNLGLVDELELAYAESDAERVAKVLTDLDGFAPEDIHILLNETADGARDLLGQLALGERSADLVLFYFSGHGDGANLHLAGTQLPMAELRRLLAGVSSKLSIAVVDACKSGALTRNKGATLAPGYAIDVHRQPEVEGSIIITSSSEDELSQESDALQASYFTHHWVAGLYGLADTNNDGLVMLEEAYRYAHFRTVETTIASRGGVQHPAYRYDLEGRGNVVLANLHRSTATVELHADNRGGRYFVLDPEKELVLTELARSASGTASVRLPPGTYRIRKREPRRSLIVDITVGENEVVTVRDADMQEVPIGEQAAKGGGGLLLTSHGPVALTGLRNGLTPSMSVNWQAELGYDFSWGAFFLEPRLVFRTAIIEPTKVDEARWQHFEYDLGLTAGARLRIDAWRLTFGASAGLILFDQFVVAPPEVWQHPPSPTVAGALPVGFQGTGVVGVGYALGPVLIHSRGFAGVAVFNDADQQARAAFVAGVALGAAWLID